MNPNNHSSEERTVPPSKFFRFRRRYGKNKAGVIGLVVLTLVLLTAFIGPLLYPVSPFEIQAKKFLPPGGRFTLLQKKPSYLLRLGSTEIAIDSEIASEIYVRQSGNGITES